jgi:hypothetical protein
MPFGHGWNSSYTGKRNLPNGILWLLSPQRNEKERTMSRFKRMSHTIWRCEYHIVWTRKYRYRVMQEKIKEQWRGVFGNRAGRWDARWWN